MCMFEEYYKKNLAETKRKIRESVKQDSMLMQAVNSLDDLAKTFSINAKRLREWYELYNPEYSKSVADHEEFIASILKKSRHELLQDLGMNEGESMGADISEQDVIQILELARFTDSIIILRNKQERYIDEVTKKICPNMAAVAGPIIAAKLISSAGSLSRLAELPASTIQLLGAEKALFRHLRNKMNRPPRHGLIVQHPLISSAAQRDHGKVARALADKISIAVKVDYFKGSFIGDDLRRKLEEKFKR